MVDAVVGWFEDCAFPPMTKSASWTPPQRAKTARRGPRMGHPAGLAHHVWTVEELVAILPEPVAKKRGPYKPRSR